MPIFALRIMLSPPTCKACLKASTTAAVGVAAAADLPGVPRGFTRARAVARRSRLVTPRHNQRDFLVSDPGQQVPGLQDRCQALARRLEHGIAHYIALGIVYLLEMFDCDEKQRAILLARDCPIEEFQQMRAVG